jgi:hypothetical protein
VIHLISTVLIIFDIYKVLFYTILVINAPGKRISLFPPNKHFYPSLSKARQFSNDISYPVGYLTHLATLPYVTRASGVNPIKS